VITKSNDRAARVRFTYHEYDYRPNGRHEVPSNHKNYNFREKKKSQVMKESKNCHWNTYQHLGQVQGGSQGHCNELLLELRCWSCSASLLACFPSLPPTFFGKYQFHTLVFPVQCCVDRCREVGCGSVAMVTSLLLRRLLPSSVATFKAPTLQYSIGLELNLASRWRPVWSFVYLLGIERHWKQKCLVQ